MPINIHNRHTYKGSGMYIGRGTVWGNPYTHMPTQLTLAKHKVATRDEAVKLYRILAYELWQTDEFFTLCLTELVKTYLRGEDINLVCSCAPKLCHGEVIRDLVEGLALTGQVTLASGVKYENGDTPF